jgi:hypothetical protein
VNICPNKLSPPPNPKHSILPTNPRVQHNTITGVPCLINYLSLSPPPPPKKSCPSLHELETDTVLGLFLAVVELNRHGQRRDLRELCVCVCVCMIYIYTYIYISPRDTIIKRGAGREGEQREGTERGERERRQGKRRAGEKRERERETANRRTTREREDCTHTHTHIHTHTHTCFSKTLVTLPSVVKLPEKKQKKKSTKCFAGIDRNCRKKRKINMTYTCDHNPLHLHVHMYASTHTCVCMHMHTTRVCVCACVCV